MREQRNKVSINRLEKDMANKVVGRDRTTREMYFFFSIINFSKNPPAKKTAINNVPKNTNCSLGFLPELTTVGPNVSMGLLPSTKK